ncbi:hypothetical protein [Streptomyces sp. NPDC050263]|uniref:hypothetical protein n=1 Tax=Streptomyces sp. NPDC050263 TaxID=3155037 RepID=UPI003419C13F
MPPEAFSAQTGRIRRATATIGEFPVQVRASVQDFEDSVGPTRSWPGESDEYARQMLPGEREEWDLAVGVGFRLAEVVGLIERGVLTNLGDFEQTQDYALGSINDTRNRPGRL